MGQAVPRQHPAVVLRSHYRQLRALLAIAMIAVVALTAGVVILATDEDGPTAVTPRSAPVSPDTASNDVPSGRYNGGPEEGLRRTGR